MSLFDFLRRRFTEKQDWEKLRQKCCEMDRELAIMKDLLEQHFRYARKMGAALRAAATQNARYRAAVERAIYILEHCDDTTNDKFFIIRREIAESVLKKLRAALNGEG